MNSDVLERFDVLVQTYETSFESNTEISEICLYLYKINQAKKEELRKEVDRLRNQLIQKDEYINQLQSNTYKALQDDILPFQEFCRSIDTTYCTISDAMNFMKRMIDETLQLLNKLKEKEDHIKNFEESIKDPEQSSTEHHPSLDALVAQSSSAPRELSGIQDPEHSSTEHYPPSDALVAQSSSAPRELSGDADGDFVCHGCGKKFRDKNRLRIHIKRYFVSRNRKFKCRKRNQCTFCYRICECPANLLIHLRVHTGERPFECGTCGKRFKVKHHLKRHIRTHTGERPFECGTCGKRFKVKYHLKRHIRTHTGKRPFECGICGKRFSMKNNLKVHIRTHTGEQPFECTRCRKRFSIKQRLKVHIRTHTGEKPFACTACGKGFADQSHCKRHERIHAGIRPFICATCEKSYVRKDDLRQHITNKHLQS